MSAVLVTPILPCGDCAHLAVCAIRPLLAPIAESADVPGIESPHEAIRITIDLRVDCGHLLRVPEPGKGSKDVRLVAVRLPARPGDSKNLHVAAEPTAPRRGKGPEPSIVPRRPVRPLGPPMALCEPGCGDTFTEGLLGAHRRSCAAYAASREGKVREISGVGEPAPLHPASVAAAEHAEAERERFAERRQEAAREAADRTWAERNGEERPLTEWQTRVLDAIRETEGDQAAAALILGIEDTPARVSSVVQKLREQRRLPADVAELLDRRKAAKGRAS